jgi:outer membrane lipoprotein LolB
MHATRFFTIIVLFLLASCASVPTTVTSASLNNPSWQQHAKQLNQLTHWQNNGAMSVITPQNAWSASYRWQQNNNNYNLRLTGPLGAGGIELNNNHNRVTLINNNGRIYQASTAEQLLAQQTGWHLPISNLQYWVRGIPAPLSSYTYTGLDAEHHLVVLAQQGWYIQYQNYRSFSGIALPTTILLSTNNDTVKVKIVIHQWQISA